MLKIIENHKITEMPDFSCMLLLGGAVYIYIYTDKTSLKADREVGGRGDEPHRWNKRRGPTAPVEQAARGHWHWGVQTCETQLISLKALISIV